MLSEIPSDINTAGSVLFLGSGFSRSATNIRNENVPTGIGLKNEFASLLGVDPNEHDLSTLADVVASRQDLNLYQILYEIFTVKEVKDYQKKLLSLPWKRIYTTNYDDVVEFTYNQINNNAPSFDYNDEKPMKLPDSSVIHLHGAIRSTTEENVLQQLVLNEASYARQHFENSLWYDDFIRDLRFCNACFFVGYSLRDYHISALLMQNQTVCKKTFFVTDKTCDPIFAYRAEKYGNILPIEAKGFADLCYSMPKPEPINDPHALKAFRYLDPFKDKKTLSPPTPIEVLNLVTFGSFNYQRILSSLPAATYVIPRQKVTDEAAAKLKDCQCLLVHSWLGNGKSIFLHILAHKLSEHGYHCFWCKPNPLMLQEDLDFLETFGKVAIFFDSYNTAVDFIEQFSKLPSEAKFIVGVRTGVHEVRLHEIQKKLPSPLVRLDLNGMTKKDIIDFKILLDQFGIRAQDLEGAIDRCKDVREVVVSLYDNRKIREKIKTELSPLLQDKKVRSILVVSNLLKWVGQDVDTAFLRSVTNSDPYAEFAKFRETAGDVFKLVDDDAQVRSATFSEYLIQNHFSSSDVIECVYEIVVGAVKRKAERRYQAILSSLMRFSFLDKALSKDPHRMDLLKGLFARLQRDIDVNKEPLFWLQYSILMTDAGELMAAEGFVRTAYSRAADIRSFRTFQIDTYAFRLLLIIEKSAVGVGHIARFEEIIEKMETIRLMIGEESHRVHSVRVLENIDPFVSARISEFSTTEMNTLVYHFNLLIQSLNGLSPDIRAQTESDKVKDAIFRAKKRILARPAE